MSISTNLHYPEACEYRYFHADGHNEFTRIRFHDGKGSDVALFWNGDHTNAAMTIEDIFNGNLEGLAERIEEVLSDANDLDVTFADFALHVACNLTGKDIDEAYRERREAAA